MSRGRSHLLPFHAAVVPREWHCDARRLDRVVPTVASSCCNDAALPPNQVKESGRDAQVAHPLLLDTGPAGSTCSSAEYSPAAMSHNVALGHRQVSLRRRVWRFGQFLELIVPRGLDQHNAHRWSVLDAPPTPNQAAWMPDIKLREAPPATRECPARRAVCARHRTHPRSRRRKSGERTCRLPRTASREGICSSWSSSGP